jgi:hypothetical protein
MPLDFTPDGSESGSGSGNPTPEVYPVSPIVPIYNNQGGSGASNNTQTSRERGFPERVNLKPLAPVPSIDKAGVITGIAGGNFDPGRDIISSLYTGAGDVLGKPIALGVTALGKQEEFDSIVKTFDSIPGAGIITGSYARALGNEPLVTAWKKYGRLGDNVLIAAEDNPTLGYNLNDMGTDIGRLTTFVMLGALVGGPLGAAIGGGIALGISAIGIAAQGLASLNPFDTQQSYLDDLQGKQGLYDVGRNLEQAGPLGWIAKTGAGMVGADFNAPIRSVGDLRNQLLLNGFTEEDLQFIIDRPDQVGVINLDPRTLFSLDKDRREFGEGKFGGGSAMMAGMGGLVNLVGSGSGTALKALTTGTKLSTKGGLAMPLINKLIKTEQRIVGATAAAELRAAGMLPTGPVNVAESIAAIERGAIAELTVQGAAGWMASRSSGLARGVRIYSRTAVGSYVGTGALSMLPGQDEGGFIPNDIAGFIDSSWAYNPLRNSELISIGAALDIPTVARGFDWWVKAPRRGLKVSIDDALIIKIADDNLPVEELRGMSRSQKRERVYTLFGTKENYDKYVNMLMIQTAARGSQKHGLNGLVLPYLEGIKIKAGSSLSLQAAAQEVGELASKRAEVLRRDGKITEAMLLDIATDWNNNSGDFAIISDGVARPGRLQGVHQQWINWQEAYRPLVDHGNAVGTVVLGVRRSAVVKENLAAIEAIIDLSNYEKLSDAGKRTFIANLVVTKMPRLIDTKLELIGEGTANFFIRAMLKGSELPSKEELLGRIRALKAKAPTYDELFEGEAIREAGGQSNVPGVEAVSGKTTNVSEVITPVDDVLERIGAYGPATTARLETVAPEVNETVDVMTRALVATDLARTVTRVETRFGSTKGSTVAPLIRLTLESAERKTVAAIATIAFASNPKAKVAIVATTGQKMASMGLEANGTRVAYRTAEKLSPLKKATLDRIVERASAAGIDIISDTRSGNITIYFNALPEQVIKDKTFKKVINDLQKAFGDLSPEEIVEPANIKRYTSRKELLDEAQELETTGKIDPTIPNGLGWVERLRSEATPYPAATEGEVARQARGNRPVSVAAAFSDLNKALDDVSDTKKLEGAIGSWLEVVTSVPASRIGLIADELGDLGTRLRSLAYKNSPLVAEMDQVVNQIVNLPEIAGDIGVASAIASLDLAAQFASTGERAGLVAKRSFVSVEQMEESITVDPAFAQIRQNIDEADAVASLDEVLSGLIAEGVASPEQVATSEILKSKTGQLREEGQFITTKGGKQVRIPQKAALDYYIRSGAPLGALEAANDTIVPVPPTVAKATISRQQIVVESNKTLSGKGWMVAKGFAPSGINHVPAETAASFLISKGIKGIPEVVDNIGARPKSAGAKATRKVQKQTKAAQVAWDKANMANITKKAKVYEKLFEYIYGFKRSAAMEQGKFDPSSIKIAKREIPDEELAQLGLRREGNEIYRVLSVDAPGGTKLDLAVGDVSTEAFIRQIEQAFNVKAGQPDTYVEAFRHANWYQDFRKAIEMFYGKDRLGKAVLYAFIHSQQAEGVVNGFAAVASIYRTMLVGLTDLENASKYLRTSRSFKAKQQYALMIGKKKVSEAIFTALKENPVAYGPGAKKITDFADSFLGKKARTVLGNTAVDSMPVAVDRHTIANTGFVDMRVAKSAAYGGGVNPELTKPGIIANEFQYEWSVEKVNQWARDLNAQGWLGRTDWTAAEIQALGWYHYKKVIGDFSGTVADAIEGSSASVLIDLVPSVNAPTLRKLMPDLSALSDDQIRAGTIAWVNSDAVTRLAQENGVAIAARTAAGEAFAQQPTVVGISKAGSTPTITLDVVGAPESITSFMRDLAVAAEQDFAVAWASLPRGIKSVEDAAKKGLYNVRPTVDIPLPKGLSPDSAIEAIRKTLSSDEEIREIYASKGMDRFQIDDLLSGKNRRMAFAVVPDTINGEGYIRIIDTNFNIQAKTNYDIAFENYSVHDHIPEIASVSNKIADRLGLPRPVHRSYQTPNYPFHRRLADRYYRAPETKNYETGRVIEGPLGPATDYNWTVRTDTNLDPAYAAAAQEFLNELRGQYDALHRAGYRFEAHAVDPYNVGADFVGSPGVPAQLMGSGDVRAGNKGMLAQADIKENKHLFVFGSYASNPAFSDEINVLFRAVHDTFGHLTDGYSFGPQGELNALIKHMQMFKSTGARKVALVELGGQNAMTNFGYAERLADGSYVTIKNFDDLNRAKAAGTLVRGEEIPSIPARPFATQKSFLIEDEFLGEFERLYLPTEAALTADELDIIAMRAQNSLSNLTENGMIKPHSTSLVATTGVSNDWAKFPDAKEYKGADVFAESGVRRLVASSGKESAAEFAPRIAAVQDEFFAARKAETESRYAAGMEGPVGEARRALVAAFTEAAPEETALHRAASDEGDQLASFSQTREVQRTETRRAQAKAAIQEEDYDVGLGLPPFDEYLRAGQDPSGVSFYSDVLFTSADTVEELLEYANKAFPETTGNAITEAEFAARVADGEMVLYRGVTRKGGYEMEGGIKGASRRIAESIVDQPNYEAGMGRSGLYGAAPRGYWATDQFTPPISGTAEEVATRYAQTEGDLRIKPADVREGVMVKATLSKDANVAILDVSDMLGAARTEIGQITINGVVTHVGRTRNRQSLEMLSKDQVAGMLPTEVSRDPLALGEVMPDLFPMTGKKTLDIVTGEQVDSRGIGLRPFNYDMITAFAIREGLDAVIIRGGERAATSAGDPRIGDQLLLFNAGVVNVVDPRLEGKQFNKVRPVKPGRLSPSASDPDSFLAKVSRRMAKSNEVAERYMVITEPDRIYNFADELGIEDYSLVTKSGKPKTLRQMSDELGPGNGVGSVNEGETLLEYMQAAVMFTNGYCLDFAKAFQKAYGGKLVGVSQNYVDPKYFGDQGLVNGLAQHVGVEINGKIYDSMGVYKNADAWRENTRGYWNEAQSMGAYTFGGSGGRRVEVGGKAYSDDLSDVGFGYIDDLDAFSKESDIINADTSDQLAAILTETFGELPKAEAELTSFNKELISGGYTDDIMPVTLTNRSEPSPGPKFVMGSSYEVRAPLSLVDDYMPTVNNILDELATEMDIIEPVALAKIIDELYYMHKGKVPRRVAPEDFNPDRYGSVLFRGLGSGGVSTQYTSKEAARLAGLDAIRGKPKMYFGNVGFGNYWALSDPEADKALGALLRPEKFPPVKTAETYAGRFPEKAGQVTQEQADLYDLYKAGKINIDEFNERAEFLRRSTGELGTVTPFKPSGVIDYASPVTEESKGIVLQAGLASDARVFKYQESAALALSKADRSESFNKLFAKWMSEVVRQTIRAQEDGGDEFRRIQSELIGIQRVLDSNMNNPEILDEVVGDIFKIIAAGSERLDRPTDLVLGRAIKRAFEPIDQTSVENVAEEFGDYISRNTYKEMSGDEGWATIYAMTHGYDAMQAVDRLEMNFGQPQVLSVFNQAALEIVDPTLSGGTLNMIRKSSTASKAEVLGRTTYVDKGKSLVQLFKGKADLSTVIHEMAHTWLNTGWLPDKTLFEIADALGIKYARTRTGANKLRIDGRLNEEFAQQFESYVTKGDWAGTPLEDSFKLLSEHMQRIYAGTDGQIPDINPDVALVFEKIFEATGAERAAGVAHGPSTLAALTRAEADLTATGDLELVERLAQMDIDAGNVPGNRPPHWDGRTHGLSADYLATLAPIQRKLDMENSPYTITGAPQLAVTPTTLESVSQYVSSGAKWRATTIGKVIEKTKIDRLFNTVGWLLEKPTAINEAQATRQFLYRELISKGATVDQVNNLIAKLNEKRTHYYHSFAATYSLKSMGYGAITKAVTEVFETTDEGRQFLKNIGGESGVVKAIERSASKIYKKVDSDTIRDPGVLSRVLATTYRAQQKVPFLRGGLRMVRWAYPTLRFYLDPRWHALNAFEADIILGSQFGLKATRFGGAKDALPDLAFLKHAGLIDERLYAIDPRKAIRDAVAQATGAKDLKAPKGQFDVETLLGEHGGGFHDTRDQRGLSGRFTRALEKIRENNARRVVATIGIDPDDDVLRATSRALDEHGELDPYIVNLRKIAEERQKPLTKVLDEELYLIDTLGFEGAMEKLEAKALSYEEREMLRPLLQRLYDMNQESYNNMLALVRGNPNRTNIEKIINNYFLYWPASYMIKATKWMMTTLMTHNGELSGVNVVRAEQFAEAHYRAIADNPDYRAMYEDNPAAWRLASMFLPVSPILSEIGASLGRPTRYVGGAIGVFPKYRASEDPGVFFESVTSYGIGYTSEMLQEVFDELTQDQP